MTRFRDEGITDEEQDSWIHAVYRAVGEPSHKPPPHKPPPRKPPPR